MRPPGSSSRDITVPTTSPEGYTPWAAKVTTSSPQGDGVGLCQAGQGQLSPGQQVQGPLQGAQHPGLGPLAGHLETGVPQQGHIGPAGPHLLHPAHQGPVLIHHALAGLNPLVGSLVQGDLPLPVVRGPGHHPGGGEGEVLPGLLELQQGPEPGVLLCGQVPRPGGPPELGHLLLQGPVLLLQGLDPLEIVPALADFVRNQGKKARKGP